MNTDGFAKVTLEVIPPATDLAISVLAEPVQHWVGWHLGPPTLIQRLAWPVIASRSHCLLASPTGTGKTLAAFLPIMGELFTQPLSPSGGRGVGGEGVSARCLYISPLKALCNDAQKTLRRLADQLRLFFPSNSCCPRLGLRTGDTASAARRALLDNPPEILLTTLESLALLLMQRAGGQMLAGMRWVIVDEVHALAAGKRGADLSLSLERLEEIVGQPLQRIGLSATCAPVEEVGRFLAGAGRSCTVCHVPEGTYPQIAIEPLGHLPTGEGEHPQRFFRQLLDRLEVEIQSARTTLIFTNTRRLAERLNWALRQKFPRWAEQMAVHHSSLAAPRRRIVERQLKQGLLRVVVSSTSLELGIDIGTVDNVVLVHPPGDVIRLLQRVGRAGHRPGLPRRGLILTSHASRLLQAVATGAAGQSGQLEPLRMPDHPLDVLCQHLLGMAALRSWQPDQAFALIRQAYPYRHLSRQDFDDCLDYLSGCTRQGFPWMPNRLRWADGHFTLANQHTLRLLRCNVGTILSEEPLIVRLPNKTAVGELEPGFAEGLLPGDRFVLDGRCLQFERLSGRSVLVEEVTGRPRLPHWSGTGWPLSTELAERLFVFRIRAGECLLRGRESLVQLLEQEYRLSPAAVEMLLSFFQRQESLSEIPEADTLLIEGVHSAYGTNYYFHTPLNRAANDALARILHQRLERLGQRAAVAVAADLGFMISLQSLHELDPEQWRVLFSPNQFHDDLQHALADSPFLKGRFRQAAYTGLLLLRNPLGKKNLGGGNDWAERRLFQQIQSCDGEFVLLRQARREIEKDMLDAPAAHRFCQQLPGRVIRLRWLPCVSPFAEGWTQATYSTADLLGDPAEALAKLHATLMGQDEAG